MKSSDNVGITFANIVIGRGIADNIVNVTLGAYNFTPSDDGTRVDNDLAIVARLRLTKTCARQLADTLSKFMNEVEKAESSSSGVAAPITPTFEHDDEVGTVN